MKKANKRLKIVLLLNGLLLAGVTFSTCSVAAMEKYNPMMSFGQNSRNLNNMNLNNMNQNMGQIRSKQTTGQIRPNQNMGQISSNQNMGRFSSNQNMGRFSSNQNMGRFSSNQNMGQFGLNQNMGQFGLNQNMGQFGLNQNMGQIRSKQTTGQIRPNQNMGQISSINNWENELNSNKSLNVKENFYDLENLEDSVKGFYYSFFNLVKFFEDSLEGLSDYLADSKDLEKGNMLGYLEFVLKVTEKLSKLTTDTEAQKRLFGSINDEKGKLLENNKKRGLSTLLMLHFDKRSNWFQKWNKFLLTFVNLLKIMEEAYQSEDKSKLNLDYDLSLTLKELLVLQEELFVTAKEQLGYTLDELKDKEDGKEVKKEIKEKKEDKLFAKEEEILKQKGIKEVIYRQSNYFDTLVSGLIRQFMDFFEDLGLSEYLLGEHGKIAEKMKVQLNDKKGKIAEVALGSIIEYFQGVNSLLSEINSKINGLGGLKNLDVKKGYDRMDFIQKFGLFIKEGAFEKDVQDLVESIKLKAEFFGALYGKAINFSGYSFNGVYTSFGQLDVSLVELENLFTDFNSIIQRMTSKIERLRSFVKPKSNKFNIGENRINLHVDIYGFPPKYKQTTEINNKFYLESEKLNLLKQKKNNKMEYKCENINSNPFETTKYNNSNYLNNTNINNIKINNNETQISKTSNTPEENNNKISSDEDNKNINDEK